MAGPSAEVITIYGNLNVSVPVDVSEDFLQEEETALHASQDGVDYLVLFVLLEFLLYVGQDDTNYLYDGYY
jgi:hypothetical protein